MWSNGFIAERPAVVRGWCAVLAVVWAEIVLGADVGSLSSGAPSSGIDVQDCVVRFSEEIEVPALASGRVSEVLVQANEAVERGTPLALLDGRTLSTQRRAAQLRIEGARLELSDEVELRFAETALAEAQAELESSRSIYSDVAGAVPMTQLRRMRLAVERGQLEVARAKKRRQQAELELQLREADLALIDEQIANLRITSPLPGVVLRLTRSVGEWVEAGASLATIARIDRLHVHALADAARIAPGDCRGAAVSVHWTDPTTEQPRLLRGRVLSVDPQLLPGARFRLRAEVVNQMQVGSDQVWQLRPGTDVRMKVHVARPGPDHGEDDPDEAGRRAATRGVPAWMNR